MPDSTVHQLVADLIRQAATKPEATNLVVPHQLIIEAVAPTTIQLPSAQPPGRYIEIHSLPSPSAEVSGEEYARVLVQEEPGIAVANLRGVERLSLVSDGTHWRRAEEPPAPSQDEPFSMTIWGGTREQQEAARRSIQEEEDHRIFAELDRISRSDLVAPVGRQWGMTQHASEHYGWHTERPPQQPQGPQPGDRMQFLEISLVDNPPDPRARLQPHAESHPPGPRYIEPSYVMNPAERVRLPEFEIMSNPTIRLDDIRARRFNLVDRIQDGSVTDFSMGTRVPYQPAENYTNEPRPYCPTVWERLLGEDPV